MKESNRIFYNFIVAYIILILIPLLSGIFITGNIVIEYEKHVKESHLIQLKKAQEILESFVDDIKWSTYQMASNTKLLRLISDKSHSLSNMERSLLIRETIMELREFLLYNTSFNSTFYIYLKNQDIIITPYSVYSHDDFNNSFNFFKIGNISSEAWHQFITTRYFSGKILKARNTIIEDFKNKEMIPYVQSLPVGNKNDTNSMEGAIVYLIGEADFIKFLDYKSIPLGGNSYISDDNNNIISSVSNGASEVIPLDLEGDEGMVDMIINNKKMFVIYTTSKKNNWKYVSVLPEEWVLKSVSFYQIMSITVMSVALIFCLVAAYKLSKQWSKPITKSFNSISEFLKTGSTNAQSFKTLNIQINELIDQSEEIIDELNDQKVFVHNAFVNRLINGFFKDEKGLDKYLKHLGFNLYERSFSVAILSFTGFDLEGTPESFDNLNNIKNTLKGRIKSEFPIKTMVSEQENTDIVLILMTDNFIKHKETTHKALNTFFSDVQASYKKKLIITLGDPVTSLMNTNKSFIQAQDILSMNNNSDELLILDVDSVDKKIEEYYYPIEMESRIINSIKSGNIENTKNLMDIIYNENLVHRKLERSKLLSFYSNMKSTLSRIISQLSYPVKEEMEDRYNAIEKYDFKSINDLLIKICDIQNCNKKSHNNLMCEEVKEFLKDRFRDKNLSLYSVSDHFSITESYLSFFFKEQTGINFSTYLETIRVKESKKLLSETNETIQYIAYKIGYNSDKTFRRVFQKNINISPSKYRLNNKQL